MHTPPSADPLPPDGLEEAIRRVQAGDAEAFASVLRAFEWLVRGWVAAKCPPGGDVDDVAQRTFIEAFKNIGRYEPGTNFKAWLLTIARYQVMAECTRLRRLADYHERYVPHALALELELRVMTPAPQAERRLELLRQCIAQLGATSRELLRLRYDGEHAIEEIARQLGRSPGAIKKHFFQIRRKLHDCVAASLPAEP
jgi:RNA polymerase sigma-70 factor (ECF subfamily)